MLGYVLWIFIILIICDIVLLAFKFNLFHDVIVLMFYVDSFLVIV